MSTETMRIRMTTATWLSKRLSRREGGREGGRWAGQGLEGDGDM